MRIRSPQVYAVCLVALAGALLAACDSTPPPEPTPTPTPSATPVPPSPTPEPSPTSTDTPAPTQAPTDTPAPTETATPTQSGASGATGGGGDGGPSANVDVPAEAQAVVAIAAADLAARQGLDASSLTVVEVTRMDWGDSSLGCPQPGLLYAEVITPGYLVVLESVGELFNYHTDLLGNVMLCEG